MNTEAWANEYRTTTVCIDSYEHRVLRGRMYNAGLGEGEAFASTIEFLRKTETMLDGMKFPQAFSLNRTFRPAPELSPGPPGAGGERRGTCGTFLLKILFRQNASWQGTVVWAETRREEAFRSVLELLMLLDSALREGDG